MNQSAKNIYLIGPRASGKTSLGRILAGKLGREFVDLDELFVTRQGQSIAQVVEAEGWERFRELESEVLKEVSEKSGLIAATGGGVVLKPENRELLAKGVTLYLQADPEALVERLTRELLAEQRPALTDLQLADEVRAVLAEREPLYMSCAQMILPQAELEELAAKVVKALGML